MARRQLPPARTRVFSRWVLPLLSIAFGAAFIISIVSNGVSIGAVVTGRMGDIPDVALFGVPGFAGWTLWATGVVSLLLFVVYQIRLGYLYTHTTGGSGRSSSLTMDHDEVRRRASKLHLSSVEVAFFRNAILDPAIVFARIGENVDRYTRSTAVRTTYTVTKPKGNYSRLVVPLHYSSRGRLDDGLSLSDHAGTRIPSLTHVETTAYVDAVMRYLVRRAGPLNYRAYIGGKDPIEKDVLNILASTDSWEDASYGSQQAQFFAAARVAQTLISIPALRAGPLQDAAAILLRLYSVYPICAVAGSGSLLSITGEVSRITVERRMLIPIGRESWNSVLGQLFVLNGAGLSLWENLWPILSFRRSWRFFTAAGRHAFDGVRHLIGIQSADVAFPLANAARTTSYHLQLKGPERMYMGQQYLEHPDGQALSESEAQLIEHVMVPPVGQRHAHLYIRNGGGHGPVSYRARFYERTPGSMAIAMLTSAAAFAVTLVIALNRISHPNGDSSGLLQILLAFPIAIAAVSGLASNNSIWGGVLASRVSTGVTIGGSLAGLAISTLPYQYLPVDSKAAWIVIIGILAVNLVVSFASWVMRALVHRALVGSR